jgi:hypothetical protein
MHFFLKVWALLILLLPYRTMTIADFSFTPDFSYQGVVAAYAAFWVLCLFVLVGTCRTMLDKIIDPVLRLKTGWRR